MLGARLTCRTLGQQSARGVFLAVINSRLLDDATGLFSWGRPPATGGGFPRAVGALVGGALRGILGLSARRLGASELIIYSTSACKEARTWYLYLIQGLSPSVPQTLAAALEPRWNP